MARLIDADELRAVKFHALPYTHIHALGAEPYSYELGWNDAIDAIMDNAPTVDAVPLEDYKSMEYTVNKLTKAIADAVGVVRCKDCFHFGEGVCKAHNDVIYMDENDFCSLGEKDEID